MRTFTRFTGKKEWALKSPSPEFSAAKTSIFVTYEIQILQKRSFLVFFFFAKSRQKKNVLLGLLEQQRCQSTLWPTELTMVMKIKHLRKKVRHKTQQTMRTSANSGICYRIKFFFLYHILSLTSLPLKEHPQGLTCTLGQDLCISKAVLPSVSKKSIVNGL